jgi:alanyl-tRNA synthetase
MDYSGEMSMEQLHEVEREANEAVWKNLPVKVMYPTEEELEDITYRSKIEIEGQIRIVEIPGYDVCACCAPHVERTGEIGIIKIVNVQRYKGGVLTVELDMDTIPIPRRSGGSAFNAVVEEYKEETHEFVL